LSQAARNNPENSEAYINLGAALASVGRIDESIQTLIHIIEIDPANPFAFNNLGIVLKDAGRYQESIQAFSEAIKIYPDYAGAYYNLGLTFFLSGQNTEAIKSFMRAIHLNPEYDNAYISLANALNKGKRYRESADLLSANIKHFSDRVEAHLYLGVAAHCLSDYSTSKRELSILQTLDTTLAKRLENTMREPCN
jgi:tetratricopeptide (TPR) repeat protein